MTYQNYQSSFGDELQRRLAEPLEHVNQPGPALPPPQAQQQAQPALPQPQQDIQPALPSGSVPPGQQGPALPPEQERTGDDPNVDLTKISDADSAWNSMTQQQKNDAIRVMQSAAGGKSIDELYKAATGSVPAPETPRERKGRVLFEFGLRLLSASVPGGSGGGDFMSSLSDAASGTFASAEQERKEREKERKESIQKRVEQEIELEKARHTPGSFKTMEITQNGKTYPGVIGPDGVWQPAIDARGNPLETEAKQKNLDRQIRADMYLEARCGNINDPEARAKCVAKHKQRALDIGAGVIDPAQDRRVAEMDERYKLNLKEAEYASLASSVKGFMESLNDPDSQTRRFKIDGQTVLGRDLTDQQKERLADEEGRRFLRVIRGMRPEGAGPDESNGDAPRGRTVSRDKNGDLVVQ